MKSMLGLLPYLIVVAALVNPGMARANDPGNLDGLPPAATLSRSVGSGVEILPGSLTIDFETFADGTPVSPGSVITDEYAPLGVTFGSADCAPASTQIDNVIDYVPVPSPRNMLAPCGPSPYNGGTLILRFDPVVASMSVFFVDDQIPVIVTAYDANGDPVAQTQSDGSNSGFDSISLASDGGIAEVEMEGGFRFFPSSPDGWGIDDLSFVPLRMLAVDIDVSPGDDRNVINPMSQGVITVALLGSAAFDVRSVDRDSLAFGPDAAERVHRAGRQVHDVDRDGFEDLLAFFSTPETGIAIGDSQTCLTGVLLDGTLIEGCDAIATVPACGLGAELVFVLPPLFARSRRRSRIDA